MNNGKFKKYWFISGTLAFVILFAFLVVDIYNRTIEGEKKDYQLQQLEMAKNAAMGIEYLLEHLSNNMKFLSSISEIKKINTSSASYLNRFLQSYESKLVNHIFLADDNGKIIFTSGEDFPEWINDSTKYFADKVLRKEKSEKDPEVFLELTVPVIDMQKASADTIGYLGYLVDFNLLVEQYIKPLKLTKEDFAWILDSGGRLIYHPHHDEMLFRSIKNTTTECYQCHSSFDIQKQMIASDKPSFGEYYVIGDEPAKVMAYYPIKLQNDKWVLVISAFVTKVTENLRGKFQMFFILGFIILGVIIFFSLMIYFVNLKRIRAEEGKRNAEEIQLYQEQLNQASKMASIGELVDSVAHEINTPAGIISAHVDGLMLRDTYPEKVSSVLNIIKRQTERISSYTKSLLNFSQRIPFNPEETNLGILMQDSIYILGHRFRAKHITVVTNYNESVPAVCADQRQVEQVFVNLLNNAIDSIDSRGTITISINKAGYNNDTKGVMVSIEDTGSGIPEENIDKIFDPFFSTKLRTNGTGLGLSITKAIVARHKGNITVQSESSKGTIFKIFFPLTME